MQRSKVVTDAIKYFDNKWEALREADKKATRDELLSVFWASLKTKEYEWIKAEILKCSKDIRYAFGNYFWIQHTRTGDPATLDLNDSQELILETIEYLWGSGRPGWLLVHKARQLGVSTFSVAMLVWRVCFHSQVMALIVAQDEGHAAYELSMFQFFMSNLPFWLQPNVARQHIESRMVMGVQEEGTIGGLNSWIIAASATKMSAFAQGKAFSDVHITEVGAWRDDVAGRIIDQDLSQMVSRPGCIGIQESKPYGADGWWYKTWHHYAKLGKGALWTSIFIPCFFEKSRTVKIPSHYTFKPNKDENKIRERYFLEWKTCGKCKAVFYAGGSAEAECQRCGTKYNRAPDGALGDGAVQSGGLVAEGVTLTDGQLAWYRMKKMQIRDVLSKQNFLQEFAMTAEEGFQVHGKTVFPEDVYNYVTSTAIDPGWTGELRDDMSFHSKSKRCVNPGCGEDHSEEEMNISIWEMPRVGEKYFAGVDAAYGEDQGDFGVVTVHRCGHGMEDPDVQVAEFHGRCDAGLLGREAFKIGKMYNECQIAIEVKNGPGEKTQLALQQMGYSNLWRWKHYDSVHMMSQKLGWVTNSRTKPMLITNFINWCRQKLIVFKSKQMLSEMPKFIKRSDWDESGEAARGHHDDCVPEGTFIQTSEGVKPIEEIKVGESVLTHKGRFRPVVSIGNRYEPDGIFEIRATGRPPLYVTAEHPVLLWSRYIKRGEPGERFDHDIPGKLTHKRIGPTKRINNTYWRSPEWKPFENLSDWKNHATGSVASTEERDRWKVDIASTMPDNYRVIDGKMVGFRRKNPCVLPRQNNLPAEIPLSEKFLMMMGYYLAEGSRGWSTVQFAAHKREASITGLVATYLRSLGLNPAISNSSENGTVMSMTSVPLNSFFKQFGKRDEKHLPEWCEHLPPAKQKWILIGYLLGDGCFRKSNGSIQANTISHRAAFQIFNISLRCGWLCGISPRKGQNGNRRQWALSWDPWESEKIKSLIDPALLSAKRPFTKKLINKKACAPLRRTETGEMVGRIRKVTKLPFCGTVYNLMVEEDHSFVANGTIISNSIMGNLICLFCHHDEHWDLESGRIKIPHERLAPVDSSDPGSGVYVMTCLRGHVSTSDQPHKWTCPQCKQDNSELMVPALTAIRARGTPTTAGFTFEGLRREIYSQQANKPVDPLNWLNGSEQIDIL